MDRRKTRVTGSSGVGIVIAIVLMVACFAGGYYLASKGAEGTSAGGGDMAAMMGMGGGAPPAVNVLKIEKSPVDIPFETIGFVEAVETVDLIPQVSGYLQSVNFEEGSLVSKGQSLFTIEKRQYQAELELRKATLAQAQAQLERSEKLVSRLKAADPKSISQLDLDNAVSDVASDKANVARCQADIALAEIDLARTEITSPIDGYIGKALITQGNYVSSASGILAKVVKNNPIRVVFSLSDKDYQAMTERLNDNQYEISAYLNGTKLEGSGKFDFNDNQIDQGTASIACRVSFDNSAGKLVPGAYILVQITETNRPEGMVIPHSAIMNTTDGSMVYVVDDTKHAQVRPIVTGRETQNGIIVESGLEDGDTIITQGLQKVQPGIEVSF